MINFRYAIVRISVNITAKGNVDYYDEDDDDNCNDDDYNNDNNYNDYDDVFYYQLSQLLLYDRDFQYH
jgi:hypothetical protein